MSLCKNREEDEEHTTNNDQNKLPVQDLTALKKIPASKSQSSLRKGKKSNSIPKSVKFKDEEQEKLKFKKKESILKFVEITDDIRNEKSEDDEKLNESRDSNISGLKFDVGLEHENEKQKEKTDFPKNDESAWNLVRESLVSSIINSRESKENINIDKKSDNNDEEKNKENLFNNSFDNNNNNNIEKNEIKDDNNEKKVKEDHIKKENENIINNNEKKEKEQNEKKSEEEFEEEEEEEKENNEKGENKENKENKEEKNNKEEKEEKEEKKIEEEHIEKENKINEIKEEIKEEKKEKPQNNDNTNNNNLKEEEISNTINNNDIKNKDDNNTLLRSKPKPKEEKKEKVQEEDEEEEEEEDDEEEEKKKPEKKETIKEEENEELSKYKSLIKIINKNIEANGFSKLDIKNQIDELYKTFPDPISEEELIPKLSDHFIKLMDITIDSDKNEIQDFIKDIVILFEGDKDKIYHQLMNFIEDIEDQDKLKNNQSNRIIRTYLKDCEEKLKNRLKEEDIPSDKIISLEKFNKIIEETGIQLKEEYMDILLYQMKMKVPKGRNINTFNAIVIVDYLK